MCAMGLLHSCVGRVFYGTSDEKAGVLGSGGRVLHEEKTINHRFQVFRRILEKECTALLNGDMETSHLGTRKREATSSPNGLGTGPLDSFVAVDFSRTVGRQTPASNNIQQCESLAASIFIKFKRMLLTEQVRSKDALHTKLLARFDLDRNEPALRQEHVEKLMEQKFDRALLERDEEFWDAPIAVQTNQEKNFVSSAYDCI